ncbi:MAG: dockerin type I repeat-containing protein, partial [Ruminococcus sp.]|nr:dockerin type I repeat-containing protein [Ruminococcus sp.]
SNVADPTAWMGYMPSGSDESDPYVFYADVPKAVTTIIWNNAVDGGMDTSQPIYYCAAQSINIPCEFYEPEESPNYPEGPDSFDNMIFVIDPDLISINDLSLKQTCGGEWYYYYGNGCYGFTKDGSEADCLRDDHYDADGNHVVPEHEPIKTPELPAIEVVPGDVDGDGVVSVMDATEIQMVLAQMKEWIYPEAEIAADFDGDGVASVMDATEIQMVQAGLK